MASFVPLGPGTLTIGTTPTDFSCEVLGGKVTHTYEEVGASRTMLCNTVRPASRKRTDGFVFDIENDLTATGLYQYLVTNDLMTQTVTFTPNTAKAAKWTGPCVMTLPAEIGADEYGAPIVSSVEWTATAALTYTVATTLMADEEMADEAVA